MVEDNPPHILPIPSCTNGWWACCNFLGTASKRNPKSKMNTPPSITTSTREERANFVRTQWECMHNCELCGKCHVLKGKDAEFIYSEYIEGKRSYMDITLELRSNQRFSK